MTAAELAAVVEGIVPVLRADRARANARSPSWKQQQAVAASQIAHLIEMTKDMGPMRERLAVVETREPIPGPVGPAGPTGPPGIDPDAVDYEPGKTYMPSQTVRHKHAWWVCRLPTTPPPGAVTYGVSGTPAGPQGKDCWKLLLSDGKPGRDGKDGKDGRP